MRILNLGCGTLAHPSFVNVDWSVYLRLKKTPLLAFLAKLLLKGERHDKFLSLPDNIVVHNLSQPLPFPDACFDAVYHSHFLEHLDQPQAAQFLKETARVLKDEGIHRLVVPDLEQLCRRYLLHLDISLSDTSEASRHNDLVADIIEQMVRRESAASRNQPPLKRFLENLLFGDARRRGETHQWMYDRVSLSAILSESGFGNTSVKTATTSSIPDWSTYGMDTDAATKERHPHSLYIETTRTHR